MVRLPYWNGCRYSGTEAVGGDYRCTEGSLDYQPQYAESKHVAECFHPLFSCSVRTEQIADHMTQRIEYPQVR